MKDINDILCTIMQMSDVLGVTDTRVRQLIREDILYKDSRGKYPLVKNVKAYLAFKDKAASSIGGQTSDYNKHRTDLTETRKNREAMELEILQGKYVLAEDSQAVFNQAMAIVNGGLRNQPSRLSGELVGMNELQIFEILERENDEILQEAASTIESLATSKISGKDSDAGTKKKRGTVGRRKQKAA